MKKAVINLGGGLLALLAILQLGISSARADQTVGVNFNMPVHVSCHVDETGCDNSPGPQITLDGDILLGGLKIALIFQNNLKGTHTAVVTFETNVVLLSLGSDITIPKQPVLGGVGGNPYIYMQFVDSKGKGLSDEIFLGRCVQGLTLGNDFINAASALTVISAGGCDNNPGPVITMGGSLTLSGLSARIIFRNNVKGTHTADVVRNVSIIVDGTSIEIPKSPHQGGAGGNPLVFVQFLQSSGDPIGSPIALGRCNKL
jgi:hypothetical protein